MANTPKSTPDPEKGGEAQPEATVVPIKAAKTAKAAAKKINPPPDPVVLKVLKECDEHKTDDGKPMLVFFDGEKPNDVIKEAIQVVVAENKAKLAAGGFHKDLIFRSGKGNGFVTLAKDDNDRVVIKPLTPSNISLGLQARFCYKVERKKGWIHKPNPGWFASALTYGDNEYRFPALNGLLQHPALHLDGTIVTREGYDPVTGTWVVAGWDNLTVPEKPTAAQVLVAVQTLREPFEEVIFKGDKVQGQSPVKKSGVDMTPSEANVLGMLLTGFFRKQMPETPFFPITSSQMGTAKGLISSVVSHLVTGSDTAILQGKKKSEYMTESNMDRFLLDHPDELFVQLDETSGRWHTDQMAMLATADRYFNRPPFGRTSERADVRRVFAVTGRNLRPDKDMVRRVSMIELGIPADGTKPEERVFKHADRANKVLLREWVVANRRRFIEAIMMLVNSWQSAGCPKADFNFDFPHWVDVVGGILQNAGITAWMSNRGDIVAGYEEAQRASFILALMQVPGVVSGITSRKLSDVLTASQQTEGIQDLLTWDDPWAMKLFFAWGDRRQMTYNFGRLLSSMEGELMSDGNGQRVMVTAQTGKGGRQTWYFVQPGQPTSVKRPAHRPTTKPAKPTP